MKERLHSVMMGTALSKKKKKTKKKGVVSLRVFDHGMIYQLSELQV